jgi:uncharacterized protein with GYD domain
LFSCRFAGHFAILGITPSGSKSARSPVILWLNRGGRVNIEAWSRFLAPVHQGGSPMPRYALLMKFTDKGVATVKDSPKRGEAFRAAVKKAGGNMDAQYWLLGKYDVLVIISAPDENTATSLALDLGRHGNVRTMLCRAFDETEFKAIVDKL